MMCVTSRVSSGANTKPLYTFSASVIGAYAIQQHSSLIVGRLSVQSRYNNVIGTLLFPQWPVFEFVTIKVQTIGWRRVIAANSGVTGAFV